MGHPDEVEVIGAERGGHWCRRQPERTGQQGRRAGDESSPTRADARRCGRALARGLRRTTMRLRRGGHGIDRRNRGRSGDGSENSASDCRRSVRKEGEWEHWLDFLLDGVATISEEATASARDLFALVATDRERVLLHQSASVAAIRLFETLPRHPIVSVASAMKLLQTSKPTATRAIEALIDTDILQESTGKKRDRSFAYHRYLERLRDGTELGVVIR